MNISGGLNISRQYDKTEKIIARLIIVLNTEK